MDSTLTRWIPALRKTGLRKLVGSGDRIALFTLPVVAVGLALYVGDPSRFAVDGSSRAARVAASVVLLLGVVTWAWSVGLILAKVPKGELITTGPYAIAKHPLYTSVGLLVLPAAGFLLGTWLGALIGVTVYAGSRMFAPAEEAELSAAFGEEWEAYRRRVKLRWL
jgi:protein-S-isoprenylcysteine O-methyltransferase Ste14